MIIITTQCFYPKIGGIESLMTGMANAMAKNKENILVLADGKKDPKDKEREYSYSIKRFNAWKPIRRIQKANYLKKICTENKVKAIFADSWKSIEYLDKKKIKIIVLAHGTEIPKKTWNKKFSRQQFKKNRITSSYKNAHKIIANSNYTKELMQASLEIDSSKIKVIHPGIDIYEDFISKNDERTIHKIIDNRFPVITTLARIEERKGHKFILAALADLKKEFPNIIYLIAGQGPYLNEIKALTKKLNLEKQIVFLGWITEPEKSLILKNSDLFIMTPTIVGESVEGFGMAFIDAAFHGIASIGTDSGGISDAIIDQETGILCKQGDQENITKNMKMILADSELRTKMGKKGKQIAIKNYSWKNKAKEYLNEI